MFSPWGFPFTFYCAIQIFAIFWLRGGWRLAGLLPVPLMAYVVYVTDDAYRQHSNLWPLLLIFASPVMFIILAVLSYLQPNRPNEERIRQDEERE
jgi:hypothetical protein